MDKQEIITKLANGETVTFDHKGYSHEIGLSMVNPALVSKMSPTERLQWAIEVANEVFEQYGLEDDSNSKQEDSKVVSLADLKRNIDILRGFDELKDLSDKDLMKQIEGLPDPYMLEMFLSYQNKGITSYYDSLQDILNMAEHALLGKEAPPSLLDD